MTWQERRRKYLAETGRAGTLPRRGIHLVSTLTSELARCDREIARCNAELLNGNPDIHGACLGLGDWRREKRLIEAELRK